MNSRNALLHAGSGLSPYYQLAIMLRCLKECLHENLPRSLAEIYVFENIFKKTVVIIYQKTVSSLQKKWEPFKKICFIHID